MVVKVCGIKTPTNIAEMSDLDIDMVGLNFYSPSKRYITEDRDGSDFEQLPSNILRVGVFVNATIDDINRLADKYKLDYIQLHGDEDLAFCRKVAKSHKLIKVFRVDEHTDLSTLHDYDFAKYLLFDTATKQFGGSGKKFDWSVLHQYQGEIPFLLSGGIGPEDAGQIAQLEHRSFAGIDINSKFESEPGIKSIALIKPFLDKL